LRFSVFTDIYRGLVSLVLPTSPATGSLTDLIRALEKRALSTPTAGSLGEIANVIQDAAADTAPTSGSVVDLIRVLEKRAISGAAADSVGARIDAAVSSRSSHTAADVWTVEPDAFDDHRRSFAARERVEVATPAASICDALLAPTPGEIPFEINRRLVKGSTAVSDEQVRSAIRFAAEELHLVVEPGGVVGLAALLSGVVPGSRSVVVVLSGANVDPAMLMKCLAGR